MTEKYKKGTFIDGIAASEVIDSSGERIIIKGVDISSLVTGTGGIYNFEHQSKDTKHTVGKILVAKKIFKRSDCENDRQKYFWDKIKVPYIYTAGELFDGVGHESAKDIAAMLRYDTHLDKRKARKLIHFSIEGSQLDKDGSIIKKCIARKITITLTPCNHTCEAEELIQTDDTIKTKKSVIDKILGKSEANTVELMKANKFSNLYNTKLVGKLKPKAPSPKLSYKPVSTATGEHREGALIKPKRTFASGQAPEKMKVGDRIQHQQKKPRTGKDIYNDPETWKSEKGVKKSTRAGRHHDEKVAAGTKSKWETKYKAPKGKEKGIHHQDKSFSKKKGQSVAGSHIKGNSRRATSDWGTVSNRENKQDVKEMHQKVISEQRQMKKPNLPKSDKYISNMRKALMAGSGFGSPSTKTGTQALSKEDVVKVCKSISDDNWETFTKKEEIVSFLTNRLPNCTDKQILALAKTVSYLREKKREKKLIEVLDV